MQIERQFRSARNKQVVIAGEYIRKGYGRIYHIDTGIVEFIED